MELEIESYGTELPIYSFHHIFMQAEKQHNSQQQTNQIMFDGEKSKYPFMPFMNIKMRKNMNMNNNSSASFESMRMSVFSFCFFFFQYQLSILHVCYQMCTFA